MSTDGALTVDLSALVLSYEEASYSEVGFGHRHVAAAEKIVEIARVFCEAGYFLEMLTAEDRRELGDDGAEGGGGGGSMRVVYTFNRMDRVDRHLVTVDLEPRIPGAEAPSIAGVFVSADWNEREVFDMYGIGFAGHPNLKRILLPEDADFHALLKDFGRIEDAPAEGGEG